jgi:ankyrin repeat protein
MAPIHDAVRGRDVEAVRRELAAGVSPDLEEISNYNYTPLMVAASNDQLEITLLLIEAGADVDKAASIFTPLIIACHRGNEAIIAALLAAGASVSRRVSLHHGGQSSLPVERVLNNHKRVVSMLLRAGSPLPHHDDTIFMNDRSYGFNAAATNYVNAVAAAGGYVPYARAHRQRLVAIFVPKFTWLPAEVVPTIVDFWAHVGHY